MPFLPLSRCSRLVLTLLGTLAATMATLDYLHWDERGLLWLKEHNSSNTERAASIWLPDYRVTLQGKALAGLENDEASDLAYNPATGTLFTVTGKHPMLVELSRAGEVLRRITLKGFANPEGVAVLENGNVALVDERRRSLSIFELSPQTHELNLADGKPFDLGYPDAGNKGFESIAWDPTRQRLLLGKERNPITMFSLASNGDRLLSQDMQALPDYDLGLRNLSALSVDPRTGHILALSAQSNLLLELDEHGQALSFISLLAGMNGLDRRIPRAEGVALDEDGAIYMVSEPNLFYVFRKQDAPATIQDGPSAVHNEQPPQGLATH